MQKFHLELLFHIIGISSASGLIYDNDNLYLISDNSHMLYEYNTTSKELNKTALVANDYNGPLENIPKKQKPDYEAIVAKDGDLYLFGSGSGEDRNSIGHINKESKETYPHIDATDLYLIMQSFGEIAPEDFNIEGAVNDGSTWYVFQRGNGPAGQNGVFTLEGDISDTYFQIIYNEIKLPKINGVQSGFTDAVKVENKIYFLAAAERSGSTQKDGKIAGSLIGRLDIETMKIEFTQEISDKKFEGITLYKTLGNTLEFLLCEDPDNKATQSDIYKLTIQK